MAVKQRIETYGKAKKTEKKPMKKADSKAATTKASKGSLLSQDRLTFEDDEDEEEFPSSEDEEDDDNEKDEIQGFESSDQEETQKVDTGAREANVKDIQAKIEKAKKSEKEPKGVLYIGRIPHGFYEEQMRSYFSQFGNVTRLRLSRNKRTGKSKHYAFLEFDSETVAKIVADTMDNYLLFGHILQVKLMPKEKVHQNLFIGANKKFVEPDTTAVAKFNYEKPKTREHWQELAKKREERTKQKNELFASMGIDYEFDLPSGKESKVTKNTKPVKNTKTGKKKSNRK